MLDQFVNHLNDHCKSDNTIRVYRQDLEQFATWFKQSNGEEMTPKVITPTDVRLYREHLVTIKNHKASTVNRRLASIRAYTAWARDQGIIEYNPANGLKRVPKAKQVPHWLTRQEQFALIREAEKQIGVATSEKGQRWAIRNHTIIIILLNTGLRVGELCGMQFRHLTLSSRKGEVTIYGKGTKQRTIPLNNTARKALEHWFDVYPYDQIPTAPVFVGQRGSGHINDRAVEKLLDRIAQRINIEVTPHMLRHTFAKSLVDSGVSIEKVAALLGHSDLSTTMIYTTPGRHDLENAVGALDVE
jgi:site-specific recombinase XerD